MYEDQHKVSKKLYEAYGVYLSIASEKNIGKEKFNKRKEIFENLLTSSKKSGPDTQLGSETYKATFNKEYVQNILNTQNPQSILSIPGILSSKPDTKNRQRMIVLEKIGGVHFLKLLKKDYAKHYIRSLEGEEE